MAVRSAAPLTRVQTQEEQLHSAILDYLETRGLAESAAALARETGATVDPKRRCASRVALPRAGRARFTRCFFFAHVQKFRCHMDMYGDHPWGSVK